MLGTQLFNKYRGKAIKRELGNALKLELLSCHMMKEALSFWNGSAPSLERFDPIVGDTACQIRADKVIALYNDAGLALQTAAWSKVVPEAIERILAVQELCGQIEARDNSDEKRALLAQMTCGWDSFLLNHGVQPHIVSEELQFLILSYVITRYCSEFKSGSIQMQGNLDVRFGLSFNFILDLCNEARKKLNAMTNQHLHALAKELEARWPSEYVDILVRTLEHVEHGHGFATHGAYSSFALLLLQWWTKKMPIKFDCKILCHDTQHPVHEIIQYYTPGNESEEYVLADKNNEHSSEAGIVLQGITDLRGILHGVEIEEAHAILARQTTANNENAHLECSAIEQIKDRISSIGIKNILLASGATHHQFISNKQEIDFARLGLHDTLLQKKYEYYKRLGNKEGLSKANPSTFRLTHVYPSINCISN